MLSKEDGLGGVVGRPFAIAIEAHTAEEMAFVLVTAR
jgi:hypothetical protein